MTDEFTQRELKSGLYELDNQKKWLISVAGRKYLFVGNETNANIIINDLIEPIYHETGKEPKSSKREIKSLSESPKEWQSMVSDAELKRSLKND
jgi:hypothetical protein